MGALTLLITLTATVCSLTGKPRDSESYGSLYSEKSSLDMPSELTKESTHNKTDNKKPSIDKRSRHVHTRFCLLF